MNGLEIYRGYMSSFSHFSNSLLIGLLNVHLNITKFLLRNITKGAQSVSQDRVGVVVGRE